MAIRNSIVCVFLIGGLASAQSNHKMSKDDVDRWMMELSNWGRWGKDDQLGALNLVNASKRKQAAALVKEGYSVSLARDVEMEKAPDNPSPFNRTMLLTGLDSETTALDAYQVAYHGFAHTHLDALCHVFYHGKMFNGFSKEEVTKAGAAKNSILNAKSGLITRGILIDIPVLRGVEYLEPGDAIYPEDLDAWEKKTGVKISAGDAVFVRTGRWARRKAKGPWAVGDNSPGLHVSCVKWIHDHDVAILGSDVASDVIPSQVEGARLPIHQMMIVALGVSLIDDCDLEALSQAAAQRRRYTFMLTAAPLAVPGGTGSPINPIATF